MANDLKLVEFRPSVTRDVLSWIASADEARNWANLDTFPIDPAIFSQWHVDPDIRPFLLFVGGAAVGYGEVWTNFGAGEAELARILIKPTERFRGVGRRLVMLLLEDAAQSGLEKAFVRVLPGNSAAIASYTRCGFLRATADNERLYNRGQPNEYLWFERRVID